MNLYRIAVPLAAAVLVVPLLAQAQTRRDNREEAQEYRIQQGQKSGTLTDKEAARLRKGQDHVRDLENKAEYDGKVTAEERARIEKAQDRQSRRITRESHDKQSAQGGTRPQ